MSKFTEQQWFVAAEETVRTRPQSYAPVSARFMTAQELVSAGLKGERHKVLLSCWLDLQCEVIELRAALVKADGAKEEGGR